jgi:hypothetical protein
MMDDRDGYSSFFYVMLIIGALGVVGLLLVLLGAASGSF